MTGNTINLAIVGLGYWGQRHVESALASGRFKVVRAVDIDPDNAVTKKFAESHGIVLSASIEDVLNDPAVDAVTLATPHNLHPEQIKQAAAAGKHVYTEKPFALRKAAAEQAVAACRAADVILALGHDQRFYPTIVEIKRLIDDGEMGTLVHIEANLSHDAYQVLYRERSGKTKVAPSDKSGYAESRKPAEWRFDTREAPTGPHFPGTQGSVARHSRHGCGRYHEWPPL